MARVSWPAFANRVAAALAQHAGREDHTGVLAEPHNERMEALRRYRAASFHGGRFSTL